MTNHVLIFIRETIVLTGSLFFTRPMISLRFVRYIENDEKFRIVCYTFSLVLHNLLYRMSLFFGSLTRP